MGKRKRVKSIWDMEILGGLGQARKDAADVPDWVISPWMKEQLGVPARKKKRKGRVKEIIYIIEE